MKIKCIIIDDEPLAISVIENHLKNFDHVEIVETFNNPLKAYRILEQEKIDLIFTAEVSLTFEINARFVITFSRAVTKSSLSTGFNK